MCTQPPMGLGAHARLCMKCWRKSKPRSVKPGLLPKLRSAKLQLKQHNAHRLPKLHGVQPPLKSRCVQPPLRSRSVQPPLRSRSGQPPLRSRSVQPQLRSRSEQPQLKSRSVQPQLRSRSVQTRPRRRSGQPRSHKSKLQPNRCSKLRRRRVELLQPMRHRRTARWTMRARPLSRHLDRGLRPCRPCRPASRVKSCQPHRPRS